MLGRLLKYEFKATARIMLPFLGGLLVIALAANLGIRLIGSGSIATILGAFIVVAYFLAICAVGAVTLVLLVYRFYRSLLSDEGYLSFSLPVSVHRHLWSKLIVSAAWMIVAFAALVLSVMLVASPVDLVQYVLSDLGGMFERFAQAWGIGFADLAAFVLELVLFALLSAMATCLMFYASMGLGFSFSHHKVIASAAIFIGIGILSQMVSLGLIATVGVGLGAMPLDLIRRLSYIDYGHVFLLSMSALELVYCAALYAAAAWSLSRRLNLP